MSRKQFQHNKPFTLESGGELRQLTVAYHTYGELNAQKDNVLWVCHALTANSDVQEWWPGMFGSGKLLDPDKYFIVCANVLGSCYGTTGPLSINPETSVPYFNDFPLITIRDMVKAHALLADELGIEGIHTLVGSSLGGQQALEWLVQEPKRFQHAITIATNAMHSPWGIAFNETQRMAIEADSTWGQPFEQAGWKGLQTARAIGMLSYRHYNTYEDTQKDRIEKLDDYKASSYQRYQGEKLAKRFNAYTYHRLSKAMDSHRLDRGRSSLESILKNVKAKTLCIGIETDLLFPVQESKLLAKLIPAGTYAEITSKYGHDGFLLENEQLLSLVNAYFDCTMTEECFEYQK